MLAFEQEQFEVKYFNNTQNCNHFSGDLLCDFKLIKLLPIYICCSLLKLHCFEIMF